MPRQSLGQRIDLAFEAWRHIVDRNREGGFLAAAARTQKGKARGRSCARRYHHMPRRRKAQQYPAIVCRHDCGPSARGPVSAFTSAYARQLRR
jgi:hypothetical protein